MYRRYLVVTALLVVGNLVARERPGSPKPVVAAPAPPRLIPITDPELAGSACSTEFLREIQRHPHWTLRIDAYEDRDCGLSPQVRDAMLTITDHGATWQRDGRERYDGQPWTGNPMPERLELTASERAHVLEALDGVCAERREPTGGWHLAVAIDPTGDPVAPLYSAELEDALGALQDRYTASRAMFAQGLSAHLSYRVVDDRDRVIRQRIDLSGHEIRVQYGSRTETFDASDEALVEILDCLANLPHAEDPVLWGTVTVGEHMLWIAAPRDAAAKASCLQRSLYWRPGDRLVATPTRYLPPNDEYISQGYLGFEEAVGLPPPEHR